MTIPTPAHPPSALRRRSWGKRAGDLILGGCLLAPSIWMLTTIPPLWRDLDAYIQLTRTPASATYMGHGPLYGTVARVPLYVGNRFEQVSGAAPASNVDVTERPQLTDSGVFLIILGQHLLLGAAAYSLIRVASGRFVVRFLLCVVWASNPLLYTFAQCIGSESLSMILIVALAAAGLRILRSVPEPSWQSWCVFAVLLWLSLVTRHANILLACVLPVAFVIVAVGQRVRDSFFVAVGQASMRGKPAALQQALIACVAGLIAITMAQASLERLCRWEKRDYHSRIGFTFLWRLPFLTALRPDVRNQVLEQAAAHTNSSDARQLIPMLRAMLDQGSTLVPQNVISRVRSNLFPPGVRWDGARFDGALNELAWAFLRRPTREHLHAAWFDFALGMKRPASVPVHFLFATTSYYFGHAESMPQCSGLKTFRGTTAKHIQSITAQHAYLLSWKDVSGGMALAAVAALVAVCIVMRNDRGEAAVFSVVMISVGLLMVASTCLVGRVLPRYTLPFWQMLLIAAVICIGTLGDTIAARITRPAPAA
ncbi:MAG: hypothetical protein H0T11_08295 [Chthoniobacterales bacterium]|nr:hypothetical protein [Chthoniobacterales bacterium]